MWSLWTEGYSHQKSIKKKKEEEEERKEGRKEGKKKGRNKEEGKEEKKNSHHWSSVFLVTPACLWQISTFKGLFRGWSL
jgi:hypothetical protein